MVTTDELGVLVVDDMALYRRVLSDVVGEIPGAAVVGTAFDGRAALDRIERLAPDLVLLDVEMPNLNGLETLGAIRQRWPEIGVVMVSGTNRDAADTTIQALEQGALDFVPKPRTRGPAESRRALLDALRPILRAFRTRTTLRRARGGAARPAGVRPRFGEAPEAGRGAGRAPVVPRTGRASVRSDAAVCGPRATGQTDGAAALRSRTGVSSLGPPAVVPPSRPPTPGEFAALAVGVSTGGPQALTTLLPALSPSLAAPVFVVQHMPPGFTASLAAQLDRKSGLRVVEAEDGAPVEPGTVYIAPGGRHMIVRSRGGALQVGVTDAPPVKSCRPSVDVLFRSLLGTVTGRLLTLVLTGMGDDGADGVQALTRRESYNLVQDAASCVVYGMPRAIVERRLAHEVLPIHRIAERVNDLVTSRRGAGGLSTASARTPVTPDVPDRRRAQR